MRAPACSTLVFSFAALCVFEIPADQRPQAGTKLAAPIKPPLTDKSGNPLPEGAVIRLGTLRVRGTPADMVVAGDGKTLLMSRGGAVCRFDAETGAALENMNPSGTSATWSRLSQDGTTLAVPEGNGIALWDIAAGKRRFAMPDRAIAWALAPDGRNFAASDDTGKETNRIRVWDTATGKGRLLAELSGVVAKMAFSHDGKYLFGTVGTFSLCCLDVATGRELWWNNTAWPGTIAAAPDGKTLCTYKNYPGLDLLDAQSGKTLGALDTRDETTHVAFSPDGKLLAQVTAKAVVLWDLAAKKELRRIVTLASQVAFSKDGGSLFTLGDLVLRWEVATGKLLFKDGSGEGHLGRVAAFTFAPNGKSMASCGSDGSLREWNLAGGAQRIMRTDIPTWSIPPLFTPDGRQLFIDLADQSLVLLDVVTAKEVRRFEASEQRIQWSRAPSARLTLDGGSLLVPDIVSTGNGVQQAGFPQPKLSNEVLGVRRWNVVNGKQTSVRPLQIAVKGPGQFSPDGRLLFAFWSNEVYDLKADRERPFLKTFSLLSQEITFSADSRLLAAASTDQSIGPHKELRIYEIGTGRLAAHVDAPPETGPLLALSPDGRLLAAASADALHVWQVSTGKRLLHYSFKSDSSPWTPEGTATCLNFSPDGRLLATGHAYGTILLWDMAPAWKSLTSPNGPLDLAVCWDDLADADPKEAYAAIDQLVANPAKALPLLRQKLAPIAKVDAQWLAARLAELDNDKFAVREAGSRALEKVVALVESDLRRVLEKPPSTEVRMRVEAILKTLGPIPLLLPLEVVRQLRAVTVLERIGSKEARALLRELADGAADARLTQEAKAAVQRLADH